MRQRRRPHADGEPRWRPTTGPGRPARRTRRERTDTGTSRFEAHDENVAAADISRYRKNGPRLGDRALIEAIKAEGVDGATLLDIGGGIGVIQHELLGAGAASATNVEASSAYLAAARGEGDRRGLADRVTYHRGDFVDLAASIQPADVVTLDRSPNAYPDWERLASLSAERARRLYGVVIPRDTCFVRLVISAINLVQRFADKPVRAAIVPIDELDQILHLRGLSRRFYATIGPAWHVVLYRRDESRFGSGSLGLTAVAVTWPSLQFAHDRRPQRQPIVERHTENSRLLRPNCAGI